MPVLFLSRVLLFKLCQPEEDASCEPRFVSLLCDHKFNASQRRSSYLCSSRFQMNTNNLTKMKKWSALLKSGVCLWIGQTRKRLCEFFMTVDCTHGLDDIIETYAAKLQMKASTLRWRAIFSRPC
jgi:hypothetical protein